MQKSFWWWQRSDRYQYNLLPPPFSPSLISLVVYVDVKHHVYWLTLGSIHLSPHKSYQTDDSGYWVTKRCTLIKKSQDRDVVKITTGQKITMWSCLCTLLWSTRRLKKVSQIVAFEVFKQLRKDHFVPQTVLPQKAGMTGSKFLRNLGSRDGVCRRGLTVALLNESGAESPERHRGNLIKTFKQL